jgi:hypothetical protein
MAAKKAAGYFTVEPTRADDLARSIGRSLDKN